MIRAAGHDAAAAVGRADRRTAREWLVVFAIGLGGIGMAALAVLTPWHVVDDHQGRPGARPAGVERVVGIEVPSAPGGADVRGAASDLR